MMSVLEDGKLLSLCLEDTVKDLLNYSASFYASYKNVFNTVNCTMLRCIYLQFVGQ